MKKVIVIIAVVAILITGLCILANNPIISDKSNLPPAYLDAIESQSKGVYSRILPLVPIYVSVDDIYSDRVFYTIHYFPFGSVGMSYTEGNGYNIEKPLTNQ